MEIIDIIEKVISCIISIFTKNNTSTKGICEGVIFLYNIRYEIDLLSQVVVCVFDLIRLLSNISTMIPAIRTIIPAKVRMTPTIIPPNGLILTWLFAPINGRLPTNTPIFTGIFPKLQIVITYFPVISGLNVVKNCFVNSLLVIMTPFGFSIVSLKILLGICPPVVLLLRSTCIANVAGREVSVT